METMDSWLQPAAVSEQTQVSHRSDFVVERVNCLIHGNGCNDKNHALRSLTGIAALSFSAEVRNIRLDPSPQHGGSIAIAHGSQNRVMK
jgi:hypothetical protein